MKPVRTTIFIVAALLMWVVGCEVTDPGSPSPNQPPTTLLTRAPLDNDTVNHYIELRWAGNDVDGQIAGFTLKADGEVVVFTTRTDTNFSFLSTADGVPSQHTFEVIARDNEGTDDPNPPSRTFYTTNVSPTAAFADGSVPENATAGYGFQMVLEGMDDNRSLLYYSISLGDEESWTAWSLDSIFFITDPALWSEDSLALAQDPSLSEPPEGTNIISNAGLADGSLTIYARVKDSGDAQSEVISRTITIASGNAPVMNPTVSGIYGIDDFYADGSVYRRNNVETQISFSASASSYNGQINKYWYSGYYSADHPDTAVWITSPMLVLGDLPAGEYPYLFSARDIAGVMADTIEFSIRIVEQNFTDLIVIVDETRNGNGNPGSPSDEQVDLFYEALVEGQNFSQIDYTEKPYVSPYDLRNAGLVIWHGDDRSDQNLQNNTAVLTTFLNKGGRLVLSGWDVLGPFAGDNDTVSFASGSFAFEKLRIFEAYFNSSRSAVSVGGVGEFPTFSIDAAKVPSSFDGTIDQTWVFAQRGECIVSGVLVVDNPGENPYEGMTNAFYYDQSFRVAVFGVPLYFFVESEVKAYFDVLLPHMLSGL